MASGQSSARPSTAGNMSKYVIADVSDPPVQDDEALILYRWLDSLPFSRAKKTCTNRDFADGVMMAELVASYIPKIINATYYIPTSSSGKKIANWEHLNSKVFKRIGFQLTEELIKDVSSARPGMIERVLKSIRPILIQGPRAVIQVYKRLDNVRARFMDFNRNNIGKMAARPQTADTKMSNLPSSRPKTAAGFPENYPSRKGTTQPKTRSSKSESEEFKVIKNPKSTVASTSKSATEPLALTMPEPLIAIEVDSSAPNYGVLTRPSTGKSSDGETLPTNIIPREAEKVKQTEQPADSSATKLRLPARKSWLPVEEEILKNTITNEQKSLKALADDPAIEDDNSKQKKDAAAAAPAVGSGATDQPSSDPLVEDAGNANVLPEEIADEEIYLDQSGYDEDTEGEYTNETEDAVQNLDDDPVFIPSSGDSRNKRPKRRLKRVVKYEYREEFLLNGMATFQLPNSTQLENVRRDYMSSGNEDPNCRGYGFV